jgi:hypothetical protein
MKIDFKNKKLYLIEGCKKENFKHLLIDLFKNNTFQHVYIFSNDIIFSDLYTEDIFYFAKKETSISIQSNKNIQDFQFLESFFHNTSELAIVYATPNILKSIIHNSTFLRVGGKKIILISLQFSEDLKDLEFNKKTYPKFISDKLVNF